MKDNLEQFMDIEVLNKEKLISEILNIKTKYYFSFLTKIFELTNCTTNLFIHKVK